MILDLSSEVDMFVNVEMTKSETMMEHLMLQDERKLNPTSMHDGRYPFGQDDGPCHVYAML